MELCCRKIKCDRTMPCEACCKRNEQDSCRWEVQQKDVVVYVADSVDATSTSTESDRIRQPTFRTHVGARRSAT